LKGLKVMGLYLCIFDSDEEVEGVEVGSYSDFDFFRSSVTDLLEGGQAASRYPTIILHSDCDGEWTPTECVKLTEELLSISEGFKQLPAAEFRAPWQKEVAKSFGLKPLSLYDSFIDVDGEPLLERLLRLCEVAIEKQQPILFQ
jgi:hypothetical protein